MKKPQRKPNSADVARSLRELAILFGKKPPDRNDKGLREQAFGEAGKLTSRGSK